MMVTHVFLLEGASEEDLDVIERQTGVSFSDDMRCAYRIHNGQSIAEDRVGSVSRGFFH